MSWQENIDSLAAAERLVVGDIIFQQPEEKYEIIAIENQYIMLSGLRGAHLVMIPVSTLVGEKWKKETVA